MAAMPSLIGLKGNGWRLVRMWWSVTHFLTPKLNQYVPYKKRPSAEEVAVRVPLDRRTTTPRSDFIPLKDNGFLVSQ